MNVTNIDEQFQSKTHRFYRGKRNKLRSIVVLSILLSLSVGWVVWDIAIHTANSSQKNGNEATVTNSGSQQGGESSTSDKKTAPVVGKDETQKVDLGFFLELFRDRTNSVYIYVLMIGLLVVFNVLVVKRVKYLLRSYHDREYIEKNILYGGVDKIEALNQLLEEEHKGFPKQYIGALYKSFTIEKSKAFFSQLYNDYIEREETHLLNFRDSVNKSMMWIIRLGIFGTLVGLAIAFYDLYEAIGSIDVEGEMIKIKATFPAEVKDALLGNVIAVGTSLTAHLITLILELFVITLLRKEENIGWMHKVFEQFVNEPAFSSNTDIVEQQLGSINQSTRVLEGNVLSLSKAMAEFYPRVGLANKSFESITSNGVLLNAEFASIQQNLSGITEKFSAISTEAPLAGKELNSFNGVLESVNKFMSELGTSSSALGQNFNALVPDLEKIGSLAESLVKVGGEMDGKFDQLPERLAAGNEEFVRLIENTTTYNNLYKTLAEESSAVSSAMQKVESGLTGVSKNARELESQFRNVSSTLSETGTATFGAVHKYINALKGVLDKLNPTKNS